MKNKAAIFSAASACQGTGDTAVVTSKLLTAEDAERAFAEWKDDGGSDVTMRLTRTADGDVAAEFRTKYG